MRSDRVSFWDKNQAGILARIVSDGVSFRRGSSRVSYCNEIGQGFLLEWGQAGFFTVEMGQTGFSIGMESARDPNALIKKKIKFSSYIGKFRVEQLQSHI